jgi:hypothetical protein
MIKAGDNKFASRRVRRPSLCLGLLVVLFVWGAGPLPGADIPDQVGVTDRLFRLAFSSRMFSEIKIDDARAAMKVWMMTVARDRGIPIDPEPKIYESLEEMLEGSRVIPVEGFSVTTEECWRLRMGTKFDRLAVAVNNGRITEEYVILVHRDSGIEGIPDLRGRSLDVLMNPRMSLAIVWLDTLLVQKGMNPTANFLSLGTPVNKLSQVVLPVFFRKRDACLVTRRGFQMMSELNPQVEKQLRILATSPELVPTLFAFRSDYASPYREQMLVEMRRLPDSPAGQQILTLMQTEKIEERPMSCLDDTFELLETHQRLCSTAGSAKVKTEAPGLGQSKSVTR